jgi:nucleotide-binding universal stress UspA family protein
MLKQILIPMDGSWCSEQAAQVGLALAQKLEAKVTLLQVVDPDAPVTIQQHHQRQQQGEGVLTETLIKTWMHEAEEMGIEVVSNVKAGLDVAEAISRKAEYGGFDLIVMGTHGREGLPRAIWGSVAERVAHDTSVPVMFVRRSDTDFFGISPEFARGTVQALGPKFERILVPIDADQISLTAVAHALELARGLNATLELMHVTINPANLWSELELLPVYNGKMLLETQRIMREALALIETKSRNTGLPDASSAATTLVEVSELQGGLEAVNRVIVRHAKRSEADLIVMGTNARSGVLKWLVGSVAEAVIHHAEVPVLLVRALEVRVKDSDYRRQTAGRINLEPNG